MLTSGDVRKNTFRIIISDLLPHLHVEVICVIEVEVISVGWLNSKCSVRSCSNR